MKISNIEVFMVKPRWLFLKIDTDEGISGWGEPLLEGRADTVAAAIKEMSDVITGMNPENIEDIWQTLYRCPFYKGGSILLSAISGIDQALWDIKGKAHNMPVFDLIGGRVRNKIMAYTGGGSLVLPYEIAGSEETKIHREKLIEDIKIKKEKGYRLIKMSPSGKIKMIDSFKHVNYAAGSISEIREAFGYDIDIALDFHGRIHKGMTKLFFRELDAYGILFYEEPVLPDYIESFKEVKNYTATPIAAGERNYHRKDFLELLYSASVDILNFDVSHAGGISECRRIAAMAEACDICIAPHGAMGPVNLASSLQIDASSINAVFQEVSFDITKNSIPYLKNNPFNLEDGHIKISGMPGLGIEVDEEAVRYASVEGHSWRDPVWRTDDGAAIEW